MGSAPPLIVGVFQNTSSLNCSHNHNTNIGHAAGSQISAHNIGPGILGHNNNSGAGAGGFNSGECSGSINNWRNCEGKRVGEPLLLGGGSSKRVRGSRFNQGQHFSRKFRSSHYENNGSRESVNRHRVPSIHNPRTKFMWIPKQRPVAVDNTNVIEFEAKEEERDWLEFSAVGCLREPEDIDTVNENLREQSFTFCKAIPMEGNLVLLQCSSNNDLSTLIDKGSDLLERLFKWVKPWCRDGVERFVSLRFEGVPLDAYTERFFRMVVGSMRGRFISMDDSTINKRRLDVARVLIRTTSKQIISKSLTVRIRSNDYNFKVIEETDQNSAAVDSDRDNDGAVVDGRLGVNSRSEFSGNTLCNFQTCSSESIKNQDELGSQNAVPTNTFNGGGKPSSPMKKLNANAEPYEPVNLSFRLICNGKEVSDKDSAVFNGRLEEELSDGGLCKRDERERREKKIITGNGRSEFIQTAQQTCSLGSKQDGCREEDGEIGSSDKGSQKIVKSGPHKNHPGGSSSKNCGSDTSRTIGNGDKDGAGSRDSMVKGDAIATQLQICQRSLPGCQKEISIIRKRDKNASIGNGSSKRY